MCRMKGKKAVVFTLLLFFLVPLSSNDQCDIQHVSTNWFHVSFFVFVSLNRKSDLSFELPICLHCSHELPCVFCWTSLEEPVSRKKPRLAWQILRIYMHVIAPVALALKSVLIVKCNVEQYLLFLLQIVLWEEASRRGNIWRSFPNSGKFL